MTNNRMIDAAAGSFIDAADNELPVNHISPPHVHAYLVGGDTRGSWDGP
jgi:hypothetical protein